MYKNSIKELSKDMTLTEKIFIARKIENQFYKHASYYFKDYLLRLKKTKKFIRFYTDFKTQSEMFFFRSSVSRCNILRNQRIQKLNEASFVTVDECLISYIMNKR